MTVTHTILNVDTTPLALTGDDYTPAIKTLFELAEVSPVRPDGVREAVFQKTSGSDEYPMTVRRGFYPNVKANGGRGLVNVSCKVNTFVEFLDTDADLKTTDPCSVTIAYTMPRKAVPNKAQLVALILNAASWLINVDDGALSDAELSNIQFGIVSVITTDTPAV